MIPNFRIHDSENRKKIQGSKYTYSSLPITNLRGTYDFLTFFSELEVGELDGSTSANHTDESNGPIAD